MEVQNVDATSTSQVRSCSVHGGYRTLAEANDRFGSSAAVSGNTAVVGAYLEDAGGDRAGAAYVFGGNVPTPTPTPTNTPTHPAEVISPLIGDAEQKTPPQGCTTAACVFQECTNGLEWCFAQHMSGLHRPPPQGGLCDSDDTYAWDTYPFPPVTQIVPVFAVAVGTVEATYAGCTGGAWGEVLVKHGTEPNVWWSGYLHMSANTFSPGQEVHAGTILGYVSNASTVERHLHFVVYTGDNVLGGLESFDVAIRRRTVQTTITAAVQAGESAVVVGATTSIIVGSVIRINPGGPNEEDAVVASIGSLILESPLQFDHEAGEPVVNISGPPVGGMAEVPRVASTLLDANESSGPSASAGVVASIVASAAAGILALVGAAWYARRRLR